MKLTELDYYLPPELIAQEPLTNRDCSRLLVLHRDSGKIEHSLFREIFDYFNEGDLLVINNSKVIPARLFGTKPTGGKIEILLIRELYEGPEGTTWEAMWRGGYEGVLSIDNEKVMLRKDGETRKVIFPRMNKSEAKDFINQKGAMPLPPYIKRKPTEKDRKTYQTVYAKKNGSIAAPTAGLHFTEELLEKIEQKGVTLAEITLHVGVGTFKPIKTKEVEEHYMDSEYFEIEKSVINKIYQTKKRGGRIFAVGTTTTRTLEGFASNRITEINSNGDFIRGYTNIFIYPGYEFKIVDALITNFHLPKSSPLALVYAFAGIEKVKNAYAEAIRKKYRFFSYGDAMLIL